jgi:hypothetical protein
MNLSPDQAARVRRAAHLLHTELRLPRDDMLRLLPAVLRAPHFVQNRVRWLRSLGLENGEVARLVQAAPDLLALPPVVGAVSLQRLALLHCCCVARMACGLRLRVAQPGFQHTAGAGCKAAPTRPCTLR